METMNKSVVGGNGSGKVVIMNPPGRGALMEPQDALLLAAWLLALSMRSVEEFLKVYDAVISS